MRCSSDRVRVHDGYITLLDGGCSSADFDNLDTNAPEQETESIEECYWILPEAMQRILMNHNYNATMNALEAMGALLSKKNKNGEVEHNPRAVDPVLKHRRRYYRIDANVLFS